MSLGCFIDEIDELVATDPVLLTDPAVLVELHRQQSRLAGLIAQADTAFDAGRAWQADGALSAAAWLSVDCRLPIKTARHHLHIGRSMRHLPVAAAALLAGEITVDHVRLLASVRTPATRDQLAIDEPKLVHWATTMTYAHWQRSVAYWAQHADPDGSDDASDDDHAARKVNLSESLRGMWFGDMILDPISGTIVHDELTRRETEFFETDWAEARARLGREPTIDDLLRTPAQRRADALVEMAVRSSMKQAGGRRPEPLFTVLVGWETLHGRICQLASNTALNPSTLLPWLDQALLERVVFDGPSVVIDVGVAQRLFTGGTRRAVEVRDQECFHRYCETPAPECQVDHIIPYEHNGPTTQDNGRVACGPHNRNRHKPPPDDPKPPPQDPDDP